MKLQKLGGYASIILVCVAVLIVCIEASLGSPFSPDDKDPVELMTNLENYAGFLLIKQIEAILFAVGYIVITLALQERMRSSTPNLMRFAIIAASIASGLLIPYVMIGSSSMAAIVGTKDVSSFTLLGGILEGINSASHNAWGWAILLIGIAAIKTRLLPKILGYIMLICGIGLIIRFVMPLDVVTFGLLPIYFVWIGIFLIRNPEPSQG